MAYISIALTVDGNQKSNPTATMLCSNFFVFYTMRVWIRLECLAKDKTFIYGRTLKKRGYTKLGILANGTVIEVCTIADNIKIPILPDYYVS